MNELHSLLRQLPKIDRVLESLDGNVRDQYPDFIIKTSIRETIEKIRYQILENTLNKLPANLEEWNFLFLEAINKKYTPNLQRVINGTGVVIHTNLGRSLLGTNAISSLQTAGASFTNLEFDLNTGLRGSRYSLVEEIICDLTGAESAIVVNNNAAAVLLALNTLSLNKEVIVSRGQLVEIGGSFRIPDVMESSGAKMVEVGATNRTHLFDYENVICDETSLLLKVHTSNFRVIGFTSDVSAVDLVALGNEHNIPVMEDLGSGSLIDFSPWGLPKEPTVLEIVKAGVDVVTFSGDKLLGGPQAGIIVGKKDIIGRIKRNPMNRALRIDKFTLASLESVLREYYDLEKALKSVPTLSMLTMDSKTLKKKGGNILRQLKETTTIEGHIQLQPTTSKVGGGAMPEHGIESWALVLDPGSDGASNLEKWFRKLPVPLILRIENDAMIIDLRTILEDDIADLLCILKKFLQRGIEN